MLFSLYIHFPFCQKKCAYCDFCSFAGKEEEIKAYCHALEAEMEMVCRLLEKPEVDTVFLGGGTPSLVPAALMRRVLKKMKACFSVKKGCEFSAEGNPATVREAWLETLREAGCNRLSLGVQAKQERLLRLLGRIHTFDDVSKTVQKMRRFGYTNLNADVMFALPEQTAADYMDTLQTVADEGFTHISAYSLIVEPGTPLCESVLRGELALPREEETADMYEQGIRKLQKMGYRRYEISNFAKPGFQCAHNIAYWQQKYYIGLGLGAAGMLPGQDGGYIRQTNTASMEEYLRQIAKGALPVAETGKVAPEEAMFETLMLGLRMVKGVSYADFERRHGVPLLAAYGAAITKLTQEGMLVSPGKANPRLALTSRGLALQNTVLMSFMPEN